MKKATLHIMQGFIAAGKSTYAKKLAAELGAVHLNPDIWVTENFSKEDGSTTRKWVLGDETKKTGRRFFFSSPK